MLLGATTKEYCHRAIPGYGDQEGFFRLVEGYEREQIDRGVTLFDGVIPMLAQLDAAGFQLAVCSNGTMDYIGRVLEKAGILSRFALVDSGAEDSKVCALARIMAKLPGRAVMIGDRRHDYEAARALDIRSIAACYGYGAAAEYALADRLAHSPAEIPGIIAQWIG